MTDARAPATVQGIERVPGGGPYRQTIDACFAGRIGAYGLSDAAYQKALDGTQKSLARLAGAANRSTDAPLRAILSQAEKRDDLETIETHAARLAGSFEEIVVLGTGGSSLGGRTLAALADMGFGPRPGRPRLRFLDNVDGATFDALIASSALPRTGFLAISKSGSTPETLSQLLACFGALSEKFGANAAAERFTAITEPGDNPLRHFAARHEIPVLDHDPSLGGRFSVLSLVGLLPARLAGIDIASVRAGAATVLDALRADPRPAQFAPAVGAAVSVALQRERQANTTVLMPYADRLAPFGLWFRQLWAESLGKSGKGTTPIRALGTVDQHSQLQLYLDGPRDKMFTLLAAANPTRGPRVPAELAANLRLDYLAGRHMGDLLAAEQRATYDTLAAAGRPVRLLSLERIDERGIGALLMHFMLETLIAADLLGVDPFGQPAVEDGKKRARAYLAGKPGPGSATS
jgi:glucose-6-phosphate isomerase